MTVSTWWRTLAVGAVALVLAGVFPAPAAASPQDGDWMPWLGCWELVNDRVDDREQPIEGTREVCLVPASDAPGVRVTTLSDDGEEPAERLIADGSRQPVDRGGCQGWKEARFSDDGDRLFTRSSLVCEGQHRREVTGISLIDAAGKWLDIEVVRSDDRRELMMRRYRFTGGDGGSQDLALAAATARAGAGGALDAEDVVEALDHVDPAAVEAALLETESAFDVDADLLVRLDEAGVPGHIVDLMVALSFPDYFVVDDGTRDGAAAAGGRGGRLHLPVYAYGYWSPFFAPFGGFGTGYGVYAVRPVPGIGRLGGTVIRGRGYTRVRTRPGTDRGTFGRLLRSGSSMGSGSRDGDSGSGGTVTPGGHRRGGSSGRKAKPRGEGGDGG